MNPNDTITSLSTSRGKGAVALIRISGKNAFSIVEKCIKPPQKFVECAPQLIKLYRIKEASTGKTIDQIMAVKYYKPHSFTGEDIVELFCHGGELVVEKILALLLNEGAVLAEKGEFTRRAYLNGKIDLNQAEAIKEMIDSRSDYEFASAISTYFGENKEKIVKWKNEIKKILRDIEAGLEFPEEDDINNHISNTKEQINLIRKEIEVEIKKKEKAQLIEKGIIIPVIGVPNAGKSSLFNLLLECDRAIVHWEEGTTRDSIGEELLIVGEKVSIFDTAGIRETDNTVEKSGIKKTIDLIQKAALVVWVSPADKEISLYEKEMIIEKIKGRGICIVSKIDIGNGKKKMDLCKNNKIPCIEACLLNKEEREKVVEFIGNHIKKTTMSFEMSGIVRNKRHERTARKIADELYLAQENRSFGEEIQAIYLNKALDDIGVLAGETTSEEIINSIFSEFCIGK
jgi:tRNA modification GTPase